MIYKNLRQFCVAPESSIQESIRILDQYRLGILLVTDRDGRLLGTITDGDIRRAILDAVDFQNSVDFFLKRKKGTQYANPLTASAEKTAEEYRQILKEHHLLHLPIVDEKNGVVGLVRMADLLEEDFPPLQAVVMAGGKGERLKPLTDDLPKPMLPIGEKPLLERIIGNLRDSGIHQVHVTTHHQPEKIIEHFGDGEKFDVSILYVSEEKPLGTAGSLSLLENPKGTLLVINGDVLTSVNFRAMHQFHKEQEADLTVGVRAYTLEIPYGVVECDHVVVTGLLEKPKQHYLVNAGIYMLEPVAHQFIPKNRKFHMTDLISKLILEKRRVVSFPIHEYWLDIGDMDEYRRAQDEVKNLRGKQ